MHHILCLSCFVLKWNCKEENLFNLNILSGKSFVFESFVRGTRKLYLDLFIVLSCSVLSGRVTKGQANYFPQLLIPATGHPNIWEKILF